MLLLEHKSSKDDERKAAQLLQEAASRDCVLAQYNLGLLYESGTGVEKDLERAKFWFKRRTIPSIDLSGRQLLPKMIWFSQVYDQTIMLLALPAVALWTNFLKHGCESHIRPQGRLVLMEPSLGSLTRVCVNYVATCPSTNPSPFG